MKQAVILAGGKGTRLASVSSELPKSMIHIGGKPVLEHAIEKLARAGITDIHFFTGYKSEVIESYFGDGKRFGIIATYHLETEPMGTAGGVIRALSELDDEFLVVYGDTVFDIDFQKFIGFHHQHNSDTTLFLQPCDHMFDSDLISLGKDGQVTTMHSCPHAPGTYLPNMANAALYIFNKSTLSPWAAHKMPLDFAHDILPALSAGEGKVFGYVSREYIRDMGTPERFKNVEADIASLKLEHGSLKTKRPAIFIDRDGTVNHYVGYVLRPEQLELEEGAAEAIEMINHSNYLAVLVTNQANVARGEVSEEVLKEIHNKMEQDLGQHSAYFDRIYYCPHYSEQDFADGKAGGNEPCNCRKPKTGLIEKAVEDLNIDIECSWFVGDTTIDVMAAKNAGIKSILVHTGEAGRDGKFAAKPDFEAKNLLEAAQLILYKKSS